MSWNPIPTHLNDALGLTLLTVLGLVLYIVCVKVLFLKVAPPSLLKSCLESITKNKDLLRKEVEELPVSLKEIVQMRCSSGAWDCDIQDVRYQTIVRNFIFNKSISTCIFVFSKSKFIVVNLSYIHAMFQRDIIIPWETDPRWVTSRTSWSMPPPPRPRTGGGTSPRPGTATLQAGGPPSCTGEHRA